MEDKNKTLEAKITRDIEIYNGVLTEDYQENIGEFLKSFASKFQINWTRDITVKISSKHNEDGANLIIKFQSKHAEEVDPNQLKLFESNSKSLSPPVEKSKEEKKSNVKELTPIIS
jgi:hypothetical protein